ncbi:hypothetical protein BDV19DRAFT_362616 [Aspergillus venezuelensis]
MSVHEEGYAQVVRALGLADATPAARIRKLLESPTKELLRAISPTVPVGFAVCGDLV